MFVVAFAVSLQDSNDCAADVLQHLGDEVPLWRREVCRAIMGDSKLTQMALTTAGMPSHVVLLLCWYHLGLNCASACGAVIDYDRVQDVRIRLQSARTVTGFEAVKAEISGLSDVAQRWLHSSIVDRKESTCEAFIKVFRVGVRNNQEESVHGPFNEFYKSLPASVQQLAERSLMFERHQQHREQQYWAKAQYDIALRDATDTVGRAYSSYILNRTRDDMKNLHQYSVLPAAADDLSGAPRVMRISKDPTVEHTPRVLTKIEQYWVCDKCPSKVLDGHMCVHDGRVLFENGESWERVKQPEYFFHQHWRIPQAPPPAPFLRFKLLASATGVTDAEAAEEEKIQGQVTYEHYDDINAEVDMGDDNDQSRATRVDNSTVQTVRENAYSAARIRNMAPQYRNDALQQKAVEVIRMYVDDVCSPHSGRLYVLYFMVYMSCVS